jgi:hypothetical protein
MANMCGWFLNFYLKGESYAIFLLIDRGGIISKTN